MGCRSDPCKNLPLPGIEVTDQEDSEEDCHPDGAEPAQLLEADGPGEEEDRLDVEDDEEDGDEEVADGEAVVEGQGGGGDAALVRLELDLIFPGSVNQRREDEQRHDRYRKHDE